MSTSRDVTPLEAARRGYEPRLPPLLRAGLASIQAREVPAPMAEGGEDGEIRASFPRTAGRPALRFEAAPPVRDPARHAGPLVVGVVLSGGQAPGGHNVIAGLLDGIATAPGGGRLLGFLDGPRGILEGRHRELDSETVVAFRNAGGFDLLGSGRDKIETPAQLAVCAEVAARLRLSGLVVVGGDDSNTNAATLAEFMLERGLPLAVAGVPKTIDGDLKGSGIETSFGFDTATRVFSELIGSIARDAASARKYWHFIKLMGRSASHVTLECALQVRPNVTLIGEEIDRRGQTLDQVADAVAEIVRRRARAGRSYGVCLVPEGLIEFVPEMRRLIAELNGIVGAAAGGAPVPGEEWAVARLSPPAAQTFGRLPAAIRAQLLLDRDAHGNVQVSQIDTERLVVELVSQRVAAWRASGEFPGRFQVQGHFFGYEGRAVAPSNFDADYAYALGRLAAVLVGAGRTGYLCGIAGLAGPPEGWRPMGIPITGLMRVESRRGRRVPVVGKALVRLEGPVFAEFARERERWAAEDHYRYPGPLQYFGPDAVCHGVTRTLELEAGT